MFDRGCCKGCALSEVRVCLSDEPVVKKMNPATAGLSSGNVQVSEDSDHAKA